MNNWGDNKRWSDQFIDEIKGILGLQLVAIAPFLEDRDRNSDLMVMTLQPYRVACRIRRHKFYVDHPHDFTIRVSVPSGLASELTKIIQGWGDYFFYGFASEDETNLTSWFLADLNVFRLWFNRQIVKNEGQLPGVLKDNTDGSSSFRVFDKMEMPSDFIVASDQNELDL